MSLDDLYRDVILDHYQRPRNHGRLDPYDLAAEGANPLCGDELIVFLRVADDRVADVRFEGRGCSISQASASMMTQVIKGKRLDEVREAIGRFKAMMHGADADPAMGDLVALQGVRKFPVRVKCATLAWVAVEQALDGRATGRAPVPSTTDREERPAR